MTRTGLLFCSAITHWSESRRTRNHTLLSHMRLPQLGEPGPRIYIPQEQGGRVMPPGTGFTFRRLWWLHITVDGQSASLSWCQVSIWDPRPIFSLLSLIIFRQLRVCWCEMPSLTRSRVCSFQFLLGITNAVFLRSEFHGTHEHILSLFLRLPQPGGPGSCICFPQNRLAQLYHRALCLSNFLIIALYIYSSYMQNTYIRPLLGQACTADYVLLTVVQVATQG
jgi:hypothetical protein